MDKLLFTICALFLMACQTEPDIRDAAEEEVAVDGVSLQHQENEQKVVVMVDGRPFTEYRYDPALKKPVLFPIRAANGTILTRGYPLEPRPGEQTDHLHHVGHWMNHGVVNQVDFWATTSETQSTDDKTYGVVRHRTYADMRGGEKGELTYIADWISDRGDTLLVETTAFVFSGDGETRTIDRITTLTARDEQVVFEDSKEGMMAFRVARFLEQPYPEPQELVGVDGKAMAEKTVDTLLVKGRYFSSEGLEGDAVWGSRAKWVMMASDQDSIHYSVTIMDHPENVNYPTHWMARGYGLFAANPLGSSAYTDGKEVLNFTLSPEESVTFSYRILLHNGGEKPSSEKLNEWYNDFAQAYSAGK
jgi:hypothetical protein